MSMSSSTWITSGNVHIWLHHNTTMSRPFQVPDPAECMNYCLNFLLPRVSQLVLALTYQGQTVYIADSYTDTLCKPKEIISLSFYVLNVPKCKLNSVWNCCISSLYWPKVANTVLAKQVCKSVLVCSNSSFHFLPWALVITLSPIQKQSIIDRDMVDQNQFQCQVY